MNRKNYSFAIRRSRHYACRAFLLIIISVILVGCSASRHASVKHRKKPSKTEIAQIVKGLHGVRKDIVEESLSWVGTPYAYAGSEKGKGADCSGMVLKVYEKVAGIKLPRNSAKQADFCKKIMPKDVRPGDLVFFATGKDPDKISHVGIMIDDTRFVHSSTSKGVVISDATTPYYVRTFKMYGRAIK